MVVDLALSPKSNSAYQAMDATLADLRKNGHLPIPNHLRDGHYAGSKELGMLLATSIRMPILKNGWTSNTCPISYFMRTTSLPMTPANMSVPWA